MLVSVSKHIGEVLYASVKNEFDAVVDKCQVTIYHGSELSVPEMRHEAGYPRCSTSVMTRLAYSDR